jgi:hypothetical protein
MKSFRQKHLEACYGRNNHGFRRAVFVQQGVHDSDWSMCEWCVANGCGKELKLELLIKDSAYTCHCEAEHVRVDHEDDQRGVHDLRQVLAQEEEVAEEKWQVKSELYGKVHIEEPLSRLEAEKMRIITERFKAAFFGPPPCPGDEKDYEYVECPDCGSHKTWVKKEAALEPIPQVEEGNSAE